MMSPLPNGVTTAQWCHHCPMVSPLPNDVTTVQLPSFEDVLHCTTIRHIPVRARPAFDQALSSTLQNILHNDNVESLFAPKLNITESLSRVATLVA